MWDFVTQPPIPVTDHIFSNAHNFLLVSIIFFQECMKHYSIKLPNVGLEIEIVRFWDTAPSLADIPLCLCFSALSQTMMTDIDT